MKEVVITGAARTAIGSLSGALADIPAPKLGAVPIAEAISRSGIRKEDVDQVIMGNVLPAGTGQAPARQAGIYAGIPVSAGAVTINKMCGSGLKSVMLAAQAVATDEFEVVVAGGMESMSQAPYALPKARGGYRMGHGELRDLMIHDGLWDPYGDHHMGHAAELCGVGDQLGTIEPGKLADLIVVAADPLENITNLRRLLLVLKEGRIVSDKRGPNQRGGLSK